MNFTRYFSGIVLCIPLKIFTWMCPKVPSEIHLNIQAEIPPKFLALLLIDIQVELPSEIPAESSSRYFSVHYLRNLSGLFFKDNSNYFSADSLRNL